MPKQLFPALSTKKTTEIKNTVNPIWTDESFTFPVPLDVAVEEGASIVFIVFDYDLIGRNDIEGECVLPLNILDGLNKEK